MSDPIEEVVFWMQDGRTVRVCPGAEGWVQYGVADGDPLRARFLDAFWNLLEEYQMSPVVFGPEPEDD